MNLKKHAVYLPYAVFIIALLSTMISLFFSEVLKFAPCVLCWYQRIFMYPIVFVSGVNIMRKHSDIYYYILPLSFIGLFIALYQNLLIWHIIPETIAPCTTGVSCIEQPLTLLGFITIPLGSLLSFAVITIFMLKDAKLTNKTGISTIENTSKKTVKQTLRK